MKLVGKHEEVLPCMVKRASVTVIRHWLYTETVEKLSRSAETQLALLFIRLCKYNFVELNENSVLLARPCGERDIAHSL